MAAPFFHFDFTGKKSGSFETLPDLTGRVNLNSGLKLFLIQENALRIADSSIFNIPAKDLSDLSECFTLSAWVKTSKRGVHQPVFVKGYKNHNIQFQFGVNHLYPVGQYQDGGAVRGIHTVGTFHQTVYLIDSRKYATTQDPTEFIPGKWQLLTWVFDRGKLDIYLDGNPIMRFTPPASVKLKENGRPLFIGCERADENARRNVTSGDMLLNDLRLWSVPLSQGAIAELYRKEAPRYSKLESHNSWDPKPSWKCFDYAEKALPGYDPEYRHTLPSTAAYLKNRSKAIPIDGNPESRVVSHDGVSHLMIGGREYYPLMAQSNSGAFNVDILNPDNKIEKVIEDVAAQGFDLIGVKPCPWRDVPLFWQGYRKYDFSSVDVLIRKALKAAPNARIQFAVHPEMNTWFQNQHKDSLEISLGQWSSQGQRIVAYHGNMGSDIWIKVSDDMLYELVKHIESQDYAGHVYDYKLFMSGGGEWHWPMCFFGCVGGYSIATRDSFRVWLKERYGTDQSLREAWGNPKITLDTVTVPTPEERKEAEFLIFRDPRKSRSSYDFQRYMADRTLLALQRNTESIKRGCNYRKTVTVYFGYAFHFMGDMTKLQTGSGILGKVLCLKSVDHIGTPISYRARGLSGSGHNINPFVRSVNAHNKLLWQENDLRTHLNPAPEHHGWTTNEADTIRQLRRGFAQSVTAGCGFWYFPGYQYHSESLVQEFANWKKISDGILRYSRSPVAEAAMIFDEESMYDLSSFGNEFLRGHSRDFLNETYYAGAPLDCWLMSDIDNPQMPKYKVYFFVNAFRTTPELRQKIREKLSRDHAVAVWFYAPGLIGKDGFDTEAMRELTGIQFKMLMTKAHGALKLSGQKHQITGYGNSDKKYLLGPLVSADDNDAEILGTLGTFSALALKKTAGFISLWSLMPLDRKLIAGIYDFAGVHRYQTGFDVSNANQNFIMLHAASAGTKTVYLREPSEVTELFSGRHIGSGIRKFSEKFEFGDTHLYRIVPSKNNYSKPGR